MTNGQDVINSMLKSIAFMIDKSIKQITKNYEGIVVSKNGEGDRWNVRYNGETHSIKLYGGGTPRINSVVEVFVPQGNQSLAWFSLPFAEQFKAMNLELNHPIGSFWVSEDSENPEVRFGGKWEQIKDRFILAAGDQFPIGTVGGEATHVLTKDELPSINGKVYFPTNKQAFAMVDGVEGDFKPIDLIRANDEFKPTTGYGAKYETMANGFTFDIGKGQAHNNMPPYYTAYVWIRIE